MTAVLAATDALRHSHMFDHDDHHDFASGAADWKAKYHEVADLLAETRNELEEFTQSSKELEEELERDLERAEKVQKDLKLRAARAEQERDEWKTKFMSLQTTHNTTTTSLQRELDMLRQEQQQTKVQLRDLEMGNDDLERNERAITSSLADVEAKYSRALEEKILLEHELLDKANLEEECQRLKDELRDANEEIGILRDQAMSQAPSRASMALTDVSSSSAVTSASQYNRTVSEHFERASVHDDLQLSDLSPSKKTNMGPPSSPSKPRHFSQSTTKTPRGQTAILRHAGFNGTNSRPNSTGSGIATPSPNALSRSTTAPIGKLARPTATSSPRPGLANRTNLTPRAKPTPTSAVTATTVTAHVPKSKGVQMVSEMRARVKNLEQKIHTRVPRLRMGSVSGRTPGPVNPPPSAFVSSANMNLARAGTIRSPSAASSHNSLLDELNLTKRASPTFDSPMPTGTHPGDSSGWVLIMDDTPSPAKNRASALYDTRRSVSPTEERAALASSTFRPMRSTSTVKASLHALGASTSTRPPKAPAGGLQRSKSTAARVGLGDRSLSASTAASTSSIPTPHTRPTTPTHLPLPVASLYATGSSSGSVGKRAPAPSAYAPKRSSLGGNTSPPSGIRPPSAGGYYASFRDSFADESPGPRPPPKDPGLNKSRIGRPGGGGGGGGGGGSGGGSGPTRRVTDNLSSSTRVRTISTNRRPAH